MDHTCQDLTRPPGVQAQQMPQLLDQILGNKMESQCKLCVQLPQQHVCCCLYLLPSIAHYIASI